MALSSPSLIAYFGSNVFCRLNTSLGERGIRCAALARVPPGPKAGAPYGGGGRFFEKKEKEWEGGWELKNESQILRCGAVGFGFSILFDAETPYGGGRKLKMGGVVEGSPSLLPRREGKERAHGWD